MNQLKKFIFGLAGMTVIVTGAALLVPPAEGHICKPSMIPPGYYPTGATCSQTCESGLLRNTSGNTFCAIYGEKY